MQRLILPPENPHHPWQDSERVLHEFIREDMLALSLEAELVGVTDLLPLDTADEPYFYSFKVQCTSCRETHPNWVSISRFEQNDISGSRGEANFVWRCSFCKRESTASISGEPKPYSIDSNRKSAHIIQIDCRGLDLVEFKADGEWRAQGAETSSKFSGIDLQEGEWYDYDEKASDEVSIKDIKWSIKRA